MIREPISERTRMMIAAASIAAVILLYSAMCYHQKHINPKDTTIPNASQFVEGLKKICLPQESGEIWLWEDAKATYSRHIIGILCGVVLSIFLGVIMGCYAKVEAFFILPISLLALIPPTAMLAVYFVLLGTEMKMFVGMIAFGIFPTLTKAIYQAVHNDVTEELIFKGYTFGGTHREVIVEIVFRQILPRILENIRLMVGPAMVFLIAAEVYVGDVGFGYRLRIQSRLTNMNVVYLYLMVLGVTGYLMDRALILLSHKLCPWWKES